MSCQAREGNPLRGPTFMAAMAEAAVAGGAVAIRAEGVEDIRAIRAVVGVPLIGLIKLGTDPEHPYITPDLDTAREVADAGADWIAVDATDRPRPGGPVDVFLRAVREATGRRVLADVSSRAEGLAAAAAGADAVATTLSGYVRTGPAGAEDTGGSGTAGANDPHDPDLELVAALAGAVRVPVVAEGRVHTPEQIAAAFARGAHAVVVGTAITNPMAIAKRFAAAVPEDL